MEEATQVPEAVGIESQVRTDSSKYNAGTRQMQQYHEELNTAYNHHIILAAFKANRARDISDEEKAPLVNGEKQSCIIIGSGPSLDHSIEYLKKWEGGIICSTSHALTLMHHGIEPTHIVALDAFSTWDEVKGVDWSKTRTKLVCHPGIYPTLVENWPNEMLMYLENNGQVDSFYNTIQKRMYAWRDGDLRLPTFHYYIRTAITLFACSPPTQLFVAEALGYGNIFLCGCDFGYHPDKARFTEWRIDTEGKWYGHASPFAFEKEIDLIKCNNGLYTHAVHLYYKKNFLSAWRLCGKTIYTTDHGIITEIPYADIKVVVARQGYKFKQQGIPFISQRAEEYLASVGAHIIETNMGLSFVEAANPLTDLPQFMALALRRYACEKCLVRLTADNDADQTGSVCPQCKEGKLKREVEIDVAANMRRIMARLDSVPNSKKPLIMLDPAFARVVK